jgi:hypothetical protein
MIIVSNLDRIQIHPITVDIEIIEVFSVQLFLNLSKGLTFPERSRRVQRSLSVVEGFNVP